MDLKQKRDGLQICLFCKNSCLDPNEDDGAVYTIGAENERNLRYSGLRKRINKALFMQ